MMIGAKSASPARRRADDRAWLAAPRVLSIRPRAHVQGVLQRGRDRTIMLGRNEENTVGRPYPIAKFRPRSRWLFIAVLVVNRQMSDIDDVELQRRGCKLS